MAKPLIQPPVTEQMSAMMPELASSHERREWGNMSYILGRLHEVIHQHREEKGTTRNKLRVVDVHPERPGMLAHFADWMQAVSGAPELHFAALHEDPDVRAHAETVWGTKGVETKLIDMDFQREPGRNIRNGLEHGGADLVVYHHAAYPHILPTHKLMRMVPRLHDVAAEDGAIVTLHHANESDVDGLRRIFGVSNHSKPGLHCDTQKALEQQFTEQRIASFSVTIPNIMHLPNEPEVIRAVLLGMEEALPTEMHGVAENLKAGLQEVLGHEHSLEEALGEMGEASREAAARWLIEAGAVAPDKPIAVNHDGAQLVIGFRDARVAREAFTAIQEVADEMGPPALVMPLTKHFGENYDKSAAHAEWTERLRSDYGIAHPPRVCQVQLDKATPSMCRV